MIFGSGETIEHRLNHLEALRNLQEETAGFCSFAPSSFTPPIASVPGFEEPTAVEYLKTLAISRLYLDNIENIQSSLETQGLKVLQVGLRFGGNDAGSVLQARGSNAAHRRTSPAGHPRRRLQTRPARRPLPHHVPQLTSLCPNRKINWLGFRFYVVLKVHGFSRAAKLNQWNCGFSR